MKQVVMPHSDIEKMTRALARAKIPFEKRNPLTLLMSDVTTGKLKDDILNEKVLSAIVEIKVTVDRTEEVIRIVHEVEKEIDTVVALGVGTRCDEHGEENIVAPILERMGYQIARAKTNTGLGRITNRDQEEASVQVGAATTWQLMFSRIE